MSLSAIILAGGKGSRLFPWHTAKALMPINGRPIIDRLMDHLKAFVDSVTVCVGFRASDIEGALKENRWDFDPLDFSNAGEDATMMERLLHANPTERALVVYGDELANVSIPDLILNHERSKALMTITSFSERLPFGIFDAGAIVEGQSVKVNIGYAIVEPQAWKYTARCAGLSDFFNKLRWCMDGCDSTNVYEHNGKRTTINSPADIAKAEETWK